jgi:hypothetical protein
LKRFVVVVTFTVVVVVVVVTVVAGDGEPAGDGETAGDGEPSGDGDPAGDGDGSGPGHGHSALTCPCFLFVRRATATEANASMTASKHECMADWEGNPHENVFIANKTW